MTNIYKLIIVYFIFFGLLLLGSSIALFITKMGMEPQGVLNYYAGNETLFIPSKSIEGMLEILWRHVGSIGLFIMVVGHFFLFGSKQDKKFTLYAVITLFIATLINLFSPFGIQNGFYVFALLKLLSILLFTLVWLMLFYLLFMLLVPRQV